MTTTIGSLDLSALNNLYDETQYFWFESSAQPWGAGAHVTLYPQSEFTTSTHANYLKGQNILMNTDGFSLRNGTLPMMTLDNNSLDFNVVDTTAGTFVTTATFTSTGAQIGQSGAAHSVIDADGQRFYGGTNGATQLANIGYGEGAGQSGTAIAPYYTFGIRDSGTIGNYSFVEGYRCIATKMGAHAENYNTKAHGQFSHAEGGGSTCTGEYSHAEGMSTESYGISSHAEGMGTYSSGEGSHAEGYDTIAIGDFTHAQNYKTIANHDYSTAIGRYNAQDTATTEANYKAFTIGNGTDDDNRSNAFTVDWSGNTVMAGDVTVAGHSTPIGTFQSDSNTKSISTGTSYITSGISFTLDAGMYILVGSAEFASNATGRRGIIWQTGDGNVSTTSVNQTAVSGTTTRIQSVCLAHPSVSTTYTLYATQNSGSSLSTGFYARVTRIA